MAKVKLLDPSDPRRRLDRYELIGEIATGGMATVFLARLGGVGGFQRFVAIKRLHPHLANEQEFVEMFLDEARLAALIHHPHVVPILEVGVSDSGYYIVMEYVEGDTLSKIVARSMSGGKMVPRHILMRILLDMLSGLHAAHELADDRGQLLGLVHRDVSPQNVLVGVDGSSRITDFGVARATARLTSTGSGKLKGKLAYMAPEQTRGDELDRRTDLFAAGIICWEVLAGKRLFKAETEAATLHRILVEPVRPVSEINPEIPRIFDGVLAKALDRDPRKRFQTSQEMFDVLEHTAIESAKTATAEVGIASPREVATYVQTILGQEIGAQRESVRAWLAQSDSSAPRVTSTGMGGRESPRPRESVPHRRRRDGDEDSRSGDYDSKSYDGPPPIAPMADVTMRFALQTPPRPPPPAKQSQPTLIGQGPAPAPPLRAVPPPAAGSPAPQREPPQEIVGLATAGLGEEGDDAPTILKQSSRPPGALEEPSPHHYEQSRQQQSSPQQNVQHQHAQQQLSPQQQQQQSVQQQQQQQQQAPQQPQQHHDSGAHHLPGGTSVKTARGLFAADLLERARFEAEKAQAARAANGAAHHANGAAESVAVSEVSQQVHRDNLQNGVSADRAATSADAARNEPTSVVTRTVGSSEIDNEAPRPETAGTSLTNGSMTLPSQFQVYATGPISSPEPTRRGALRYVVLAIVGLSLAAAVVIFLQMRNSGNEDVTTSQTSDPSKTSQAAGHTEPTHAVDPATTSTQAVTDSATALPDASTAPSAKPGSNKGRPVGKTPTPSVTHPPVSPTPHPVPPTHPDPPPTATPTPPPQPPPTPGDDLSNPYHPKP